MANRNVYRLSPLRVWATPAIFLLIAIFFISMPFTDPGPPATRYLPIYVGVFFLAFAVVIYLIVRRTRLVLSDEGIKLHQFRSTLETDWANVAQLDETDGAEGLVLHRPMECSGAYRLSDFRDVSIKDAKLFSAEQIRLIAERRLIPLNVFARHLKNGRLRDDLARRTPGL